MPRLPLDNARQGSESLSRRLRRYGRRSSRAIMRSRSITLPKNLQMPIRLRLWFVLFTSLFMIVLALLGFTNIAHDWPLNDKILHFFCMGLATGIFYFIFDVDEDARRIWFWRYAGLMVTAVTCLFFGGIVSEIVQSLLPYKTFQFGDIVANLLGSSLGLYLSYHVEQHYRKRREISRLYKPVNDDGSDGEDDLEAAAPLFSTPPTAHSALPSAQIPSTKGAGSQSTPLRFKNVWDDRIDVFDIGEDPDDDDDDGRRPSPSGKK